MCVCARARACVRLHVQAGERIYIMSLLSSFDSPPSRSQLLARQRLQKATVAALTPAVCPQPDETETQD